MSDDPIATLVREADFDAYASALFAPAEARPHLLALYAFDVELARIRDLVSEPMPGEIRLQWWRDAVADPQRADAAAHPIARALQGAVSYGRLPGHALQDLIDARADDLYDDPAPSVAALEARLGASVSATLRLASLIAAGGRDPGGADAAGHGGVALGAARMLSALTARPAAAQSLLPVDRMAAHGVTREAVLAGDRSGAVGALLDEMKAFGEGHLAAARAAYADVDRAAAPAFLRLASVESDLRAAASGADAPARWRRLFRLWRASRRTPPF